MILVYLTNYSLFTERSAPPPPPLETRPVPPPVPHDAPLSPPPVPGREFFMVSVSFAAHADLEQIKPPLRALLLLTQATNRTMSSPCTLEISP